MRATIGVDIGATKIACGVLQQEEFVSPTVHTIKLLEKLHPEVSEVGIGVPGTHDRTRTEVLFAPNIHGFTNVPLVDYLSERVGLPVALENDANAAGLAEAEAAVRDTLARAGYPAAPLMRASSVTGEGIPAVLAHIEAKAAAWRERDASGGFRLAIDRSFSPAGAGLVVRYRFSWRSVIDFSLASGGACARYPGAQRSRDDRAGGRPMRSRYRRSTRRASQAETR